MGLDEDRSNAFWTISGSSQPNSFVQRSKQIDRVRDTNSWQFLDMGEIVFQTSATQVTHRRTAFNLWDLVMYFGAFRFGIHLFIQFLLGMAFEHSFVIAAIERIFFVHNLEGELFDHAETDREYEESEAEIKQKLTK